MISATLSAFLVAVSVLAWPLAIAAYETYTHCQAPLAVQCPEIASAATLEMRFDESSGSWVVYCSRWPAHATCRRRCLFSEPQSPLLGAYPAVDSRIVVVSRNDLPPSEIGH